MKKVYVLIEVTYDYHRFEEVIGVYSDPDDEFFQLLDKPSFRYTEQDVKPLQEIFRNETAHYWIREMEVK